MTPPSIDFLRAVLPTAGIYCATTIGINGVHNEPRNSPEAVAAYAEVADRNHVDAYMAMATFESTQVPHLKTPGKTQFRVQRNVQALRSLWLDIDVSEEKAAKGQGYATPQAATQALGEFLAATGLPMPLVVRSGGGMHLYWPLNADVMPGDWLPVAEALKAACKVHGLLADPSRTTDTASVLRVPGTRNHKLAPVLRPVKVLHTAGPFGLDDLRNILGTPEVVAAAEPVDLLANAPAWVANEPHIVPLHDGFAPAVREARPIIEGCQQVREAASQDEPVWHRMISVIRLCQDGDTHVHTLSAQDERYNPADTDAKLVHAAASQGDSGMPATCVEFNGLRSGVCPTCPHWGRIKSPILLGAPDPITEHVGETTVRELPPPSPLFPFQAPRLVLMAPEIKVEYNDNLRYKSDDEGVYLLSRDDDGDFKSAKMTVAAVHPTARSYAWDDARNKQMTYHFRVTIGTYTAACDIPGKDLHDAGAVLKRLGDVGVVIPDSKHHTHMSTFIRKFIETQGSRMPLVESAPHFGWLEGDAFSAMQSIYRPDGQQFPRIEHKATSDAGKQMVAHGTLEGWQDVAKVVFEPGMEHAMLALGVSFGAPLAKFTEARGFLLHAWSPTGGVGKSTLQALVNSVWGGPTCVQLANVGTSTGATMNAMMKHLAVMRNLPATFDEITNIPADQVSSLIHTLSSGEERKRLRADATAASSGSWATSIVSSANKSLRAMLAANQFRHHAEGTRILELRFPVRDEDDEWKRRAKALFQIKNHYGHAGDVYCHYLVQNAAVLPEAVAARIEEIGALINYKQEDRFLVGFLASTELGLEIAGTANLVPFDEDAKQRLRQFYVALVEENRATTASLGADNEGLITDMLNRLVPNTLVVQRARAGNMDAETFAIAEPRGALLVRVEADTGVTYISRAAIRNDAKVSGAAFDDYIDAMRRLNCLATDSNQPADNYRKNLGDGLTKYEHVARGRCIRMVPPKSWVDGVVKQNDEGEDQ